MGPEVTGVAWGLSIRRAWSPRADPPPGAQLRLVIPRRLPREDSGYPQSPGGSRHRPRGETSLLPPSPRSLFPAARLL